MKIAFISDIHSNIYSLKQVIKSIDSEEVDKIICLGDLVGYATHPDEVIDLVRSREIFTIQGNYDQAVGEDLMFCGCDYDTQKEMEKATKSLFWTQENISSENKMWLKNLPKDKHLKIKDWDIFLVHGSPRENNEYLYSDSRAIEEIIEKYDFDVLLCGHTHLPYFKVYNDRYIVNAGSAGKPKHGNPRVNYILLDVKKDEIDFAIKEVSYNHNQIAGEIENEEGLPDEFAEIFRTGKA
ncbi:MAG: metallophosphoesterase family protein [Halanaerobium sp.]